MCLEAIWGMNIQQLNCVGYDHNWVKQYIYEDDAAPLLPKGTILHLIGFLDTTPANKNLADPRNWAGGGRRSVSNMFIDLGYSVALTEEQFQAEMAKRRAKMKSRNDYDIGCPLCWAPPVVQPPAARDATAAGRRTSSDPASAFASVASARAARCRCSCVALVRRRGCAGAQTRFTYSSGQPLEPAYEGWMPNADGSFTLYFGYMNTNWLQEFDIPVGPDNSFEPGEPDRASRRTSIPRRNPFLFTIQVPKDFGSKELDLDAHRERPDAQGVRVAQDRLPDRPAGDLDRGRRRQRQPRRRAAHQQSARPRRSRARRRAR